ncbi:hypothetical protein HRM2_14800 [Desulforapulum autotrophicum HRM2]|uniref:DUF2357 domain-containing protein n=1 Tax=Desulforapulum autotrophicum (strain ATCC 43914 / DSM 3382 / VKM B-1955 / HRM2) TaxID=177437 RepID=C0Q9M5_DESAH|nr:hypothetical protein HRM2_14800 [Desulforapulum autotrophicum HRM2]
MTGEALINGHTQMGADDVMVSDGTHKLSFNGHIVSFFDAVEDKEEQVKFEIVVKALLQIDKVLTGPDDVSDMLPPPLVPRQVFDDDGEFNPLEILLDHVLKKGHLHEINRRPRIDMRYDDRVLPVSRAKRLSPSAHRHLAAHSECWQRRTLTGIQPKKIMGQISEDEYGLYENRVYARLLDRLDRSLNKRLQELSELLENFDEGLKLESADSLNYRLRNSLFSLWGETFTSMESVSLVRCKIERVQKRLKEYSKSIKGLIQGNLYNRVPRNAQVASKIQLTNILAHDQHYRFIVKLWNSSLEGNDKNILPEEKYKKNMALQLAYINYCKLLIVRSLKELGYFSKSKGIHGCRFLFKGHELTVTLKKASWEIENKRSGQKLILIPIASWNSEGLKTIKEGDKLIIPCCLNSVGNTFLTPSDWITGKYDGPLVLSPLDFYVQERLVSLLISWILLKPFQAYGQLINKLPRTIMPQLKNIKSCKVEGEYSVRLLEPISDRDAGLILNALEAANADGSRAQFETAKVFMDQITRCPFCQEEAKLTPWEGGQAFKAVCSRSDCKLEWGIFCRSHEIPNVRFYTKDRKKGGFKNNGRWSDQYELKCPERN